MKEAIEINKWRLVIAAVLLIIAIGKNLTLKSDYIPEKPHQFTSQEIEASEKYKKETLQFYGSLTFGLVILLLIVRHLNKK
jgi:hypothetical protein